MAGSKKMVSARGSVAKKPKPTAKWNNALMRHAKHGSVEGLALAIEKGANVRHKNAEGRTALMEAAIEHKQEAACFLVSMVDRRQANMAEARGQKHTTLNHAAASGLTDLIEALIKKGADIEKRSGGTTPLLRAAAWGKAEAVETLLRLGADTLALDYYGRSALVLALEGGLDDAACALIPKSDLSVKVRGESLLSVACEYEAFGAAVMLAKQGPMDDQVGEVLRKAFYAQAHNSRLDLVSLLLSRMDPWMPGSDGMVPLVSLASISYCEGDQDKDVALLILDAMRSKNRPDYDMFGVLSAAHAMALRFENEVLSKMLGDMVSSAKDSLALAEECKKDPENQKSVRTNNLRV